MSSRRLIHPLILANAKDNPARILQSGLVVAIETGVLLAQIGTAHVTPDGGGRALIAHWISTLLTTVFWIGFGIAALMKYVDVVTRSRDLGILRILGASDSYIVKFLLQETLLESIPGALLGLVLGYIANGLIAVLVGASGASIVPYLWWPVVSAIAVCAPLAGAFFAFPRVVREGVAEAL
jgi:cell division protein FtsX